MKSTLKEFAKDLRKNSTESERILWRHLKVKRFEDLNGDDKFLSENISLVLFVLKNASLLNVTVVNILNKLQKTKKETAGLTREDIRF